MKKNYAWLKQCLIALTLLLVASIVIYSCKKEQNQNTDTISVVEAKSIYEKQLKKEGVNDAITNLIEWGTLLKPIAVDTAVAFKFPIRTKSTKVKTYLVINKKDNDYNAFYQQEEVRTDPANTGGFTGIVTKRQLNGNLVSKNYYKNDLLYISLPSINALSVNEYLRRSKRESLDGQPADCCKEVYVTVTVYKSNVYYSAQAIDCQYLVKFEVCAKSMPSSGEIYTAIRRQSCSPNANHDGAANDTYNLLLQVSMDLGALCNDRGNPENPYWLDPDASDGSDYYTPPANNPSRDIIDSLRGYPCAQDILKQLPTLKNDIAALINKSFNGNCDFTIKFVPKTFPTGSGLDGEEKTSAITLNNGYNFDDGFKLSSTISINKDVLDYSTKEYILVTMYHEALHAFLKVEKNRLGANFLNKYPDVNPYFINGPNGVFDFTKSIFVAGHSQMANNFVESLSLAIKSFNPALPKATADAMASAGIINLSTAAATLNANERDVRKNNYKGHKCP